MPRGDRTGPFGEGPLTGRRMGYCSGNENPGFFNQGANWRRGPGRGFRGGAGYGRGFGLGFGQQSGGNSYDMSPGVSDKTVIENEIRILRDQLSSLEDQLSKIKDEG
jgi:hypothetical protein